jgi:hypothetical protein
MKTLTIKDLARTEALDRSAMAAVRGGWKMSMQAYPVGAPEYSPKYDSSVNATQDLAQFQNVTNATANGSAFLGCVTANNTSCQFGQNNISAI